jgi:hypothetical protein
MADTASPDSDSNVRAYLDISTEHVTEPVMRRITHHPGVIADLTPYGAWVWVPGDIEEIAEQIPQCIIDIWRRARSLGCDFVHRDSDASSDEHLSTYDWSSE